MKSITNTTKDTSGNAESERSMREKANRAKGKYYGVVKVGEKGQIVIPKEVRALFGIKPGDSLLVLADLKRGIAIPGKDKMEKIIDDNERHISPPQSEPEEES